MSRTAKPKQAAAKSKWELVTLPPFMVDHQGLPDVVPAPRREADRVRRGGAHHGEIARWVRRYVAECPEAAADAEKLEDAAAHMEEFQAASEALSKQQYEAAASGYASLLDKWGSDRAAKLNLAQCRNLLGAGDEALALLDELREALEGNIRYIVIRSRVLQSLRRREEMIDLLKGAFEKAPANPALRQEMVRVGELVPAGPDPRKPGETQFVTRVEYEKLMRKKIDELLEKEAFDQAAGLADFHLESNMPATALMLAERGLEKAAEHTGMLTVLGMARTRLGQPKEAAETFRKVIELRPDHSRARAGLGTALMEAEQVEEAREVLEKLLADEPNNVRAAELLILSHDEGEDRRKATEKLRKDFPESWVPVKLLGDLAFRDGKIEEALQLHRQAFDQHPSDDTVTMILHDLDRLERIEEAIRFAEGIPSLERRSATVRWNTANIYLKGGRVKPAIQVLERMAADGRLPFETRHSATILLKDVRANVRGRH